MRRHELMHICIHTQVYMKWALATLYTWTLDVTLCSVVSSPKQPLLMTDGSMRSSAVSTLAHAHTDRLIITQALYMYLPARDPRRAENRCNHFFA